MIENNEMLYFSIVIAALLLVALLLWNIHLNKKLKNEMVTKKEYKQVFKELNIFKKTLDKTQDCVFMFDAESLRFIYVNEGAIQQVLYSESELMKMMPFEIKPDYDEAKFRQLLKPLIADEAVTLNFEARHKRKNGEIIFVDIFLQYFILEGASPYFIAIVRDISKNKQIEYALKESETLLNRAQRITQMGHWKLNPETQEVTGSNELFRIFGLPREFSTLEAFIDVLHPDDRERIVGAIEKAVDLGKSWNMNHRLIGCDKDEKWVHTIGDAIKDDSGTIIELIVTVQDISVQQCKEAELRESQLRLKYMLEAIPDAVVLIDQKNEIILANPSFYDLFYYDSAEVIGMKFDELYAISNDKNINNIYSGLSQGAYQFNYVRKDKDTFQGETTVTPINGHNKNTQEKLVVIRDVSEREKIESIFYSLAEAGSGLHFDQFMEKVLKTLTELYACEYAFIGELKTDIKHIQTLAVMVDGENGDNFEYALLDTPCEDIINRKKTLVPHSVTSIYPKDVMLVDMGVESYFGAPLISSNGDVIGLLSIMSKSPLYVDDWTGSVLGVFATRISLELEREIAINELRLHRKNLENTVLERTSELSQARDEAEQANAVKSEFLSHMSHELRTPLNAILGFAQILELDAHDLTEIQHDNIKEILDAGGHLLSLINEVLDLARIESGKLDITLEELHIKYLLQQCLSIITPQANARDINIIVLIDEGDHIVMADSIRLKQVMLNLLSNAVKYNAYGGQITLHSRLVGKHAIRICITDMGEGLTEKEISELFISFNRLNASNNIEGSGIGLVISKKLIEIMGGEIGVTSIKGKGSTFWLEFKLV